MLKNQMIISGHLKVIFRVEEPWSFIPRKTPVELVNCKINSGYPSGIEAKIKVTHNGLTRIISVDSGLLTSNT